METVKICISAPGTLPTFFSKSHEGVILKENGHVFSSTYLMELIIAGPINNVDIKFLREICTTNDRQTSISVVEVLDLSYATLVPGEGWYYSTRDKYDKQNHHKIKSRIITGYMFYRLTLRKLILPIDVIKIESYAFKFASISTIVFPDSLKTLEQESLYGCTVEEISINAEDVLQKSLYGCHSLNKIIIGKEVKHINGAFGRNKRLKIFELAEENENFRIQNNSLLNKNETQLVLFIQQEECTQYIIPEGIERICGGAFQGDAYLTNIVMPESLRYIGSSAFAMTKVEELHIPTEVISISEEAFPASIKHIYFYSSIPPTMKVSIWYLKNATIFVPKECGKQYKQKWNMLASIIQEADYDAQTRKPRKEIKNRAFYKALVSELREMGSMNIVHHMVVFLQGRFEGETFLSVWSKNLYYIKWMVRLGTIADIDKSVFSHLLTHYPVKAKAIRNLITLLMVSQFKRAEALQEAERIRKEYMEYMAEIKRYKEEQIEVEDANRAFEEMMDEYDAWGNID